jgi:hypothetical protein
MRSKILPGAFVAVGLAVAARVGAATAPALDFRLRGNDKTSECDSIGSGVAQRIGFDDRDIIAGDS